MKCERCESDKEAEFRVISDVLDIKVCADCAREARKIGLSLEIIEIDKAKNERAPGKAEALSALQKLVTPTLRFESQRLCCLVSRYLVAQRSAR